MNKLYVVFVICLLAWGTLSCWGCGKEESPTIVEGKVVDAKTGQGVEDVEISYDVAKDNDVDLLNVDRRVAMTDLQGFFSINISHDEHLVFTTNFSKNGYNRHIILLEGILDGETNTFEIGIWPEDSWLKIVVRNILPANDSIFIKLKNKTVYPGIVAGPNPEYPIALLPGEEKIGYFPYSSNTFTQIRYGFTASDQVQNPVLVDSVFMIYNDTIEYIINY